MTPAINLLKKKNIGFTLHTYKHKPSVSSYGLEAAEAMQVDEKQVYKTLLVRTDSMELIVTILPVNKKLNLKAAASLAGCKKAKMAEAADVENSTGYILGGVSPFAQKKQLRTFLDESAQEQPAVFVSGGRRGLELEIDPAVLIELLSAKYGPLSQ